MIPRIVQAFLTVFVLLLILSSVQAGEIKTMPDFSLPSALDGKEINSDDLNGKVLLITFFATWCPPCRQEVPTLIKLQNDYGPQGFSVIGMSVDDGSKGIVKMIEKDGINYPVLMAKGKTARDFGGIIGIPTSFLVNRQGNIVKRYSGYIPRSSLEKDIKNNL